jgi:hypothetical protein
MMMMSNRTAALAVFAVFLGCLYTFLGWRYSLAFTAGYLFRPLWYSLVWRRSHSDTEWQRHWQRHMRNL